MMLASPVHKSGFSDCKGGKKGKAEVAVQTPEAKISSSFIPANPPHLAPYFASFF